MFRTAAFQIVNCAHQPFICLKEMESPYDAENPLLSAYRLGVLYYIAYTAVGTSCYNKNAFLPPVNQAESSLT